MASSNSSSRITTPISKVRMGQGDAPPRVVRHVANEASADGPSPLPPKQEPQVRMGTGDAPPRIVKHVPHVRMGDGADMPAVLKHLR